MSDRERDKHCFSNLRLYDSSQILFKLAVLRALQPDPAKSKSDPFPSCLALQK